MPNLCAKTSIPQSGMLNSFQFFLKKHILVTANKTDGAFPI